MTALSLGPPPAHHDALTKRVRLPATAPLTHEVIKAPSAPSAASTDVSGCRPGCVCCTSLGKAGW